MCATFFIMNDGGFKKGKVARFIEVQSFKLSGQEDIGRREGERGNAERGCRGVPLSPIDGMGGGLVER